MKKSYKFPIVLCLLVFSTFTINGQEWDDPITISDWNNVWRSSFIESDNATNAPESTGWFWGINMNHSYNNSNKRYGGQIAIKNSNNSPTLYFRSTNTNGIGTWAKVLHNTGDQVMNGNLNIVKSGDGVELLRFSTERPWVFRQTGSGGATHLQLHNYAGPNKDFQIKTDGGLGLLNQTNNSYNSYLSANGGHSYIGKIGGNFGIGTTNPSSLLELANLNASFGEDIVFTFKLSSAKSSIKSTLKHATNAVSDLSFYTDPNGGPALERMRITEDGKVGIGTANPSEMLDVNGTGIRVGSSTFNLAEQAYLNLYEGIDNHGVRFYLSGTSNKFILKTRLSSVDTDVLVIPYAGATAGNVGIGTNNPQSKLDVNGDVQIGNGQFIKGKRLNGYSAKIGGFESGSDILSFSEYSTVPEEVRIYTPLDNNQGVTIYSDQPLVLFRNDGNVGIGTTDPQSKLAVNGQIRATEVKVLADVNVPDYVFEEDYELRTLEETKAYITKEKHLPEIPSAAEIGENGIDLGEMNMKLLKKIEELTLYQIELLERIKKLEEKDN